MLGIGMQSKIREMQEEGVEEGARWMMIRLSCLMRIRWMMSNMDGEWPYSERTRE